MFKATCTKCDWKSSRSYDTRQRADQALKMHSQRRHEGMKTWNQNKRQPGPAEISPHTGKPKRTWTRRKPVAAPVQINFCPCCGTNLHVLSTALTVAGRIK